MHKRHLLLFFASAAIFAGTMQQPVLAQPGQSLKIVVATPAGGASDTAARLLGQS